VTERRGIMQNRRGIILGVANEDSLAWAIARRLHDEGAVCGFTYQNDRTASWVLPLFEQVDAAFAEILDVTDRDAVQHVLVGGARTLGRVDFVVHAIAGGPRPDDLRGRYLDTSLEGFVNAMVVSVYSLTSVLAALHPYLEADGAAVALSHYGAEKVFTGYNVMAVAKSALESSVRYLAADLGASGFRVNAVASSPAQTRAASGIGTYSELEAASAQRSLLRRNATKEEVAATSVFLLSPMGSGITGQTIHVDAGLSATGVILRDEAEPLVRDP
jgi:enoyl-[acyl-carrier protein] reductase I